MELSMNYSLDIVSKNPRFENQIMKKYNIDGIETVGVNNNEPFELWFKNNTWDTVQIKLSIDGVDIITGEPATTKLGSNDTFVVNPNETLKLGAWIESDRGGSQFVFTNSKNSVAVNLNDNSDHLGVIAAAVYIEGEKDKYPVIINNYPYYNWWFDKYYNIPYHYDYSIVYCNSNINNNFGGGITAASNYTSNDVSVGAGGFINQEMIYKAGLNKPILHKTLQVNYMLWDKLYDKIDNKQKSKLHPNGFPGDLSKINLKDVPKVSSSVNERLCS